MPGTYSLDWSMAAVGKDLVYPKYTRLDYAEKPVGATAAIRFPQVGNNDSASVLLPWTS